MRIIANSRIALLLGGLVVCAAMVASSAPAFAQADTTREKNSKKKGDDKDNAPMTAEDSAAALAKKEKNREKDALKANSRPLFAVAEPLEFTLIANYGALARDRDTLSTKRFDGTLIVADSSGVERRIPVKLRTRGHYRLLARNCRFVPLRIVFPDSGLKGTPFAGQKGIKLGTHCQNGDGRYDDYTRREYLAYKLFNEVTDRSFRARLARATYIDSASHKAVDTRVALFIESEDDLATRIGGKMRELRGALFDDVHAEQLLLMSLYQYAIGNTDFSLYALHNVRVTQTRDGVTYPLAYDFDFSGLVNAHYATPDPRMGIRTVRDRRFRGPCRSLAEYQAAAQQFVVRKAAMMNAIAAVPGMDKGDRSAATEYLGEFFQTLENPRRFKGDIVDACERKPGV
ncbi:MAG: hypothetical protein ACT4P7_07280 [Gemmatimonadaceae bacterium]